MIFKIIILAAGKGKRMYSDVPKALTLVAGKSILQRLHQSVMESGIDTMPIVVIGPERQKLCETFGGICEYVVQEEQLGTGHALMTAKPSVKDAQAVVVINGDQPFISAQSLRALTTRHSQRENTITMMTATVPSFDGWYQAFWRWGRILRGINGHIIGDREFKDASDDEKNIREVNPSLFCFDVSWLWKNITTLGNQNAQGEYYLTDLIAMAVEQGEKLSSIDVSCEEVIGINTQEEREIAEEILKKRYA